VGNTGVKVFTHHCEEEGTFTSFVAPIDDHCEEKKKDLPSCCQKAKEIKKDCCSDEEKIVKLSFEFHEYFDISVPIFISENQQCLFIANIEDCNTDEQAAIELNKPPPKRFGKELLIYHQVFRI
jgi:hypothetical protein